MNYPLIVGCIALGLAAIFSMTPLDMVATVFYCVATFSIIMSLVNDKKKETV